MIRGEFNVVKAVVKKNDEVLYNIEGHWDTGYTIINEKTKV